MLEALKYLIRVSASEYAKYYFHLRSMMARLGFHANEPSRLEPLDIAGELKSVSKLCDLNLWVYKSIENV